jgi:hypothetical protein
VGHLIFLLLFLVLLVQVQVLLQVLLQPLLLFLLLLKVQADHAANGLDLEAGAVSLES